MFKKIVPALVLMVGINIIAPCVSHAGNFFTNQIKTGVHKLINKTVHHGGDKLMTHISKNNAATYSRIGVKRASLIIDRNVQSIGANRYNAPYGYRILIARAGDYEFCGNGVLEENFADGSYLYKIPFERKGASCKGYVLMEWNNTRNVARLTEVCQGHGSRNMSLSYGPYLVKLLSSVQRIYPKKAI